ncbi:hypothetical protein [Methylobacterium oryzihabitans]|uniref:Uncharacterized protein n=1 Tax=Methylobacterium oryzihabitans TaxID=2499852 RepID=A0A437NSY9_9HYPH|nr:hypothetical protein [Methylobacterium oryzihabitans]RVU13130.1 hypothetical protein EOE48_27130 [Methylobacterium oryzihabitans]
MTAFWTILARRGVAALLGFAALLLAVSAAQAGQGRVEPVLRAATPTTLASLHPSRPAKLPLQVVAAPGGFDGPRHEAEGIAGAGLMPAAASADRRAAVLLPPRRLGRSGAPGLPLHERPPKTAS